MNIAICEDELEQQNLLEQLLNNLDSTEKFRIFKFSSGEKLIDAYEKGMRCSILLLDMRMKELDGIQTAKMIREYDSNCIIIITTSILEYAAEGYGVNAFDFLLKPIKEEKFGNTLRRALKQIHDKQNKLYIIENRESRIVIPLSEIIYIESSGRKTKIVCKEKTFIKHTNITSEEIELCNKGFVRISRYYLVNLQHVNEIHNETILLGNQLELKMSPKLKERVYNRFTDYIMELMK